MPDEKDLEDRKPFSGLQLIKGIAVGVAIGAACLVLDFFLGLMLGGTHVMFLNAVITMVLLICIAAFVLKKSRDTGFARGILIALAFAAIIATACGVAMGTGPLRFN